jgi:hypothetical protein
VWHRDQSLLSLAVSDGSNQAQAVHFVNWQEFHFKVMSGIRKHLDLGEVELEDKHKGFWRRYLAAKSGLADPPILPIPP